MVDTGDSFVEDVALEIMAKKIFVPVNWFAMEEYIGGNRKSNLLPILSPSPNPKPYGSFMLS